MSSKYIKKYSIPPGFQDLLSEFTKEILRNQPKDIIDFSVEYFKCLQQGLILDYAHKGVNIPCDFKPSVPKIPASLKILRNPIIETVSQVQKDHSKQTKSQNIESQFLFNQKEENKAINKNNEIKGKISSQNIEIEENKDEKKIIKERVGNILSTSDNASKGQKSSSLMTRSMGKTTNFENCIDFDEKENILLKKMHKLKQLKIKNI